MLNPALKIDRKNVALWTLYDFANSVMEVVFFLYFAQWLVVDRGMSDLGFNMIFVGSTLLLLLTTPFFGRLSDVTGVQKDYLNKTTWLVFLTSCIAALITLIWSEHYILAAVFFLLMNYFYQLSFTFYNAMLDRIAPPGKQAVVSGIGQAGNWIGQIAGLLLSIPFATGAIYFFGEPGRAQTFLPAIIIFILLALPMMLWYREKPPVSATSERPSYKKELLGTWKSLKTFTQDRNMFMFLGGYFLFNDAILTVQNNFPIYLERIFHVSDSAKSLLLVGILSTSAIGALASGFITEKFGLKRSLLFTLGSWAVILPLIAAVDTFSVFVALCVILGVLFGAVWAITRAAMVALTPPDKMNYGMSYYTIAERFATFIGPLSWGILTTVLVSSGEVRYRIAMAVMGLFVLAGLFTIRKISFPKTHA